MKCDFARVLLLISPLAALFTTAACASDTISPSPAAVQRVVTKHFSVTLPMQRYKALKEITTVPTVGTSPEHAPAIFDFALVKQQASGGTPSDSGSVCLAPVSVCAKTGANLNYWLDDATGKVQLGDPTEPVVERTIDKWAAFEAFPLCGWTTPAGTSGPYGGQCYVVVLTASDKTMSFQFLLGRNDGCKQFERCWKTQLAVLRRMLASVE